MIKLCILFYVVLSKKRKRILSVFNIEWSIKRKIVPGGVKNYSQNSWSVLGYIFGQNFFRMHFFTRRLPKKSHCDLFSSLNIILKFSLSKQHFFEVTSQKRSMIVAKVRISSSEGECFFTWTYFSFDWVLWFKQHSYNPR